MAGMTGTRVSVVVFATSFLLGASSNPPPSELRQTFHVVQSRAVVHALDCGLVNAVETAGYRRTVADVCDVLRCDRQSIDRIPLLFRLRGHRWRSDHPSVSPRRRGREPHV